MQMPQILRALALSALTLGAGASPARAQSDSTNAPSEVCDALNAPDTVRDTCPCWSARELAAIGTSWSPNVVNLLPNQYNGLFTIALLESRLTIPEDAFQIALVDIPTGRAPTCSYFFSDAADGHTRRRDLTITDAAALSCEALIAERYFDLLDLAVPVVCDGNLCTCEGNMCPP